MDTKKGHSEDLPLIEKLLPLWIVLCMATGLLIGKLINGSQVELLPAVVAIGQIISGKFILDLGHTLSPGVPVGLFLVSQAKRALVKSKEAVTLVTEQEVY